MLKFNYDALACANCGGANLHHEMVDVFDRCTEDSPIGLHVTVKNSSLRVDEKMAGNPSSRRDGIRVVFNCEHCERKTELTIMQHKGSTYLEQNLLPKNKSIIIEQYADDKLLDIIEAAHKAYEGGICRSRR